MILSLRKIGILGTEGFVGRLRIVFRISEEVLARYISGRGATQALGSQSQVAILIRLQQSWSRKGAKSFLNEIEKDDFHPRLSRSKNEVAVGRQSN
jgi:hypothetical protein